MIFNPCIEVAKEGSSCIIHHDICLPLDKPHLNRRLEACLGLSIRSLRYVFEAMTLMLSDLEPPSGLKKVSKKG